MDQLDTEYFAKSIFKGKRTLNFNIGGTPITTLTSMGKIFTHSSTADMSFSHLLTFLSSKANAWLSCCTSQMPSLKVPLHDIHFNRSNQKEMHFFNQYQSTSRFSSLTRQPAVLKRTSLISFSPHVQTDESNFVFNCL